MPVPTAPDASTASPCAGCTRREALTALALTAAGALAGCSANTGAAGPDAAEGSQLCGSNLCLDLNDPVNAALTMVDGSALVTAPADRLILVRRSATEVVALSDVCTHAGCAVRYDSAGKALSCPCHGSRFALTGEVLRGPAGRALKVYAVAFDPGTNRITITL